MELQIHFVYKSQINIAKFEKKVLEILLIIEDDKIYYERLNVRSMNSPNDCKKFVADIVAKK